MENNRDSRVLQNQWQQCLTINTHASVFKGDIQACEHRKSIIYFTTTECHMFLSEILGTPAFHDLSIKEKTIDLIWTYP